MFSRKAIYRIFRGLLPLQLFLVLLAPLILLTLLCAGPATAADVRAAFSFAQDQDGVIAALGLKIPQGSHAYANDPGDVGRPAQLALTLEGDDTPLPVYYPRGAIQRDVFDRNASINVYEGQEYFFVRLPEQSPGKKYTASLSLLICSATNCTPVDMTLSGRVPAKPGPLAEAPWAGRWQQVAREGMPVQSAAGQGFAMDSGFAMAGGADGAGQSGQNSSQGSGFAMAGGPQAIDVSTLPQAIADPAGSTADGSDGSAGTGHEAAAQSPQLPPAGFAFTIEPVFADTSVEIYGLGKALLLGILAGLLLNAMPCVLPVLTFKVTGLLMANAHGNESLTRFREHNIFFAAGILTLFTALGLLFGVMDMMWGQLYQSQEFLLIMLVLVFLMGLSMLGVFTLPVIDFKTLSKTRNPRLQAYLTGLFSTFLATPCSGPLLGGVLGWAFTQPLGVLVVVFWAVGIGMAMPYIIFSIWPGLTRLLPRPGSWMVMFEHVLGFLLLGTALYLLSILPDEKHIPVLFALLVTALAAFIWNQVCGMSAPVLRRRIGSIFFVIIIMLSSFFALRMERTPTAWLDFHPQHFSQNLGTRPMVVEFTADWCPNCKFVEATVFNEERLKRISRTYDVDFIRVDLTDANAWGTKLLEMLGSRSIPLTALFPAGSNATRPTVLRDVFTGASFDKAARETFLQ